MPPSGAAAVSPFATGPNAPKDEVQGNTLQGVLEAISRMVRTLSMSAAAPDKVKASLEMEVEKAGQELRAAEEAVKRAAAKLSAAQEKLAKREDTPPITAMVGHLLTTIGMVPDAVTQIKGEVKAQEDRRAAELAELAKAQAEKQQADKTKKEESPAEGAETASDVEMKEQDDETKEESAAKKQRTQAAPQPLAGLEAGTSAAFAKLGPTPFHKAMAVQSKLPPWPPAKAIAAASPFAPAMASAPSPFAQAAPAGVNGTSAEQSFAQLQAAFGPGSGTKREPRSRSRSPGGAKDAAGTPSEPSPVSKGEKEEKQDKEVSQDVPEM